MQRHLCVALLGLSGFVSHAQSNLPAGTWLVGGDTHYSQQHNEGVGPGYTSSTDTHSFSTGLTGGRFIAPNLAVGVAASYVSDGYRYTSGNSPSFSERVLRGFSVGPFAEYYRLLGQYFGVKGHLGVSYSHTTSSFTAIYPNSLESYQSKGNGVGANLVPSVVFFPVPALAVGASFGGLYYNYGKSSLSPSTTTTETSGYSFSAYFGLNQLALSGTFYPGRR